MITLNEFLWVEKYRPQKIADCILAEGLLKTFQSIVDSGEMQNMLFTGTAGLGKTTVARAMCNTLGLDYIIINGSDDGRKIDELRGRIVQFASSVSLHSSGPKVIIIDEADYLNPQSAQPYLRGFIEEFSNNCRFIFTCNFSKQPSTMGNNTRCEFCSQVAAAIPKLYEWKPNGYYLQWDCKCNLFECFFF